MLLDLLQMLVLAPSAVLDDIRLPLGTSEYSLVSALTTLNAADVAFAAYASESLPTFDVAILAESLTLFAMDHALDDPQVTLT